MLTITPLLRPVNFRRRKKLRGWGVVSRLALRHYVIASRDHHPCSSAISPDARRRFDRTLPSILSNEPRGRPGLRKRNPFRKGPAAGLFASSLCEWSAAGSAGATI